MAACDEREEVEPEPEEEVDLLVDDVEREHAQAVELLLARSRAHAVERATEKRDVGWIYDIPTTLEREGLPCRLRVCFHGTHAT